MEGGQGEGGRKTFQGRGRMSSSVGLWAGGWGMGVETGICTVSEQPAAVYSSADLCH